MKFIILFLFTVLSFSVYGWEPIIKEKPSYESYQFPGEKIPRHSFVKFNRAAIMISSYCIFRNGSSWKTRTCKAWKAFESIQTGNFISLLKKTDRILPAFDDYQAIALYICRETGGTGNTEVNEYSRYGRSADLMDFCEYRDGSMASIPYMIKAIKKSSTRESSIKKPEPEAKKPEANP